VGGGRPPFFGGLTIFVFGAKEHPPHARGPEFMISFALALYVLDG
jgi:hypothetical protein